MQRSGRPWSALERSSNVLDAHEAFCKRLWNALVVHGAFWSCHGSLWKRLWNAFEALVERFGRAHGALMVRFGSVRGAPFRGAHGALWNCLARSDALDLLRDAPGAAPGIFTQT